jgi:hypothetical protein
MTPMEQYKAARHKFDLATHDAERIAAIICAAGKMMTHWQMAFVSNLGTQYPPNIATPDRDGIDAISWPTAQKIDDVLRKWYKAREALQIAFRSLTDDDRRGIVIPTGFR